MKKTIIATAIFSLMVSPAFADKTQIGGTTFDTTYNNPQATAIGVGVGVAGASVKNHNTNFQSQAQGQTQYQSMINGQEIAPVQSVNITNPDNKRELPAFYGYQSPGVGEYRGPYEKGIAGKAKPWELSQLWGKEALSGMRSTFGSAKCKEYPVAKKEEATQTISVKKSNNPVVAYYECSAESDFELWGEVGVMALDAGAMSLEELAYSVTFANKSSGWNVGFGGGVTAVGNGNNDYMGGSIGGGTGIGSVTTEPISKIRAIFVAR